VMRDPVSLARLDEDSAVVAVAALAPVLAAAAALRVPQRRGSGSPLTCCVRWYSWRTIWRYEDVLKGRARAAEPGQSSTGHSATFSKAMFLLKGSDDSSGEGCR